MDFRGFLFVEENQAHHQIHQHRPANTALDIKSVPGLRCLLWPGSNDILGDLSHPCIKNCGIKQQKDWYS